MTKEELLTRWKARALSWSQISSFEYDPEQWYHSYWLGERFEETKEMIFGKVFARSVEDGAPLAPVEVYSKVEYPFRVMFGDLHLVGYADTFDDISLRRLGEFKTGKRSWTQKRADEHGQIDMYLLMNYITNKVDPSEVECWLTWLPTQENGDFTISFAQPVVPVRIQTRRTMVDILNFGARINRVYAEMETYGMGHN